MGIIPENVNFVLQFQFATCSHSLMDRISDSGSDGLGSNPDGSTKIPGASSRSGDFALQQLLIPPNPVSALRFPSALTGSMTL